MIIGDTGKKRLGRYQATELGSTAYVALGVIDWCVRATMLVWAAAACILLAIQSVQGFFCLNVKLCVNESFRNEFVQCIKENALNTRKEPKCVSYTWGEDIKEKNTFRFQEIFKDESGFNEHTVLVHSAAHSITNDALLTYLSDD